MMSTQLPLFAQPNAASSENQEVSIMKSVIAFINEQIAKEQNAGHEHFRTFSKPFSLQPVQEKTGIQGFNASGAYFLRDANGATVGVVKLWDMQNRGKRFFSEEVRVLNQLNTRSSAALQYPHPLFSGQCGDTGIVCMTVVPGDCMEKELIALGRNPDEKQLEAYAQKIEHMARCLAEFNLETSINRQLSREQLEKLFYVTEAARFANQGIEAIEKQQSRLGLTPEDIQAFRDVHDIKKEAFLRNPGYCCHTHGDTHPGNFMYDDSTKTVSMVGMEWMAGSIDTEGKPISFPGEEFGRTLAVFSNVTARSGLPASASARLIEAFQDGYLSVMKEKSKVMTPEAAEYFSYVWALRKLRSHADNLNTPDEKLGNRNQFLLIRGPLTQENLLQFTKAAIHEIKEFFIERKEPFSPINYRLTSEVLRDYALLEKQDQDDFRPQQRAAW